MYNEDSFLYHKDSFPKNTKKKKIYGFRTFDLYVNVDSIEPFYNRIYTRY